jgi:hypothetical protein
MQEKRPLGFSHPRVFFCFIWVSESFYHWKLLESTFLVSLLINLLAVGCILSLENPVSRFLHFPIDKFLQLMLFFIKSKTKD